MSLQDFISDVKKNKYTSKYVREIEGNKYLYNFYDNSIYIVNDYIEEKKDFIHSVLERYINEKTNVINFIRDYREDCFDDGGFCFYTAKEGDRYILGGNYVSYNGQFSEEFINSKNLLKEDLEEEYQYFDSLKDIDQFLNKMLKKAEELTEEDEDWFYESYELQEEDFESKFMCYCLKNLGSAFFEYSEINTKRIKNLTKLGIYKPNYLDPVEYYKGWLERENIQPEIKL